MESSGHNIYHPYKIHTFPAWLINTFHPAEEKLANQGIDEETTNHEDTTSLNGLHTVASTAAYDDDDYGRWQSQNIPSMLTLGLVTN